MPASRAARTQANAASSSTWPPWVSQLPYAISLMFRPERPRRLNSTSRTLDRALGRPEGPFHGRGQRGPLSDVGAQGDVGLRKAPAADHGRPADAVPGQPAGLLRARETLLDLSLDPAAEDDGVDDQQEEEAEEQEARIVPDDQARDDRADEGDTGDGEEEAADVAPGVDDLAHQLAHGAALPRGRGGVVAARGAQP